MSNSGLIFINKAVQSEDFNAFTKYGIDENSFVSNNEKKIFKFIERHVEENGQMPSYALLIDKVDEFVHIPNVTDKYSTLAKDIKDRKLSVEFNNYFDKFSDITSELGNNPARIIERMSNDLSHLKNKYSTSNQIGTDLKLGTESYIKEYEKRASGESHTSWKSFMPYINEEISGYTSGNMYVFYGQSGRGKSAIVLREILEMAQQGATVLLWSLEMPVYEVLTRLYTMLSAKLKKTTITTHGQVRQAGFDSRDLRNGTMREDYEASFREMLSEIQTHIKGNIIVRGVDDEDFHVRDVSRLQEDIQNVKADVVVIDPMYYMNYEANTSKTTGGDAQATSVRLRRLAGQENIALLVMTQAEEVSEDKKETVRQLKIPERSAVKKTKALLEDASTLIGIDTDYTQSRGIVGIKKGRHGGEGTTAELTFLPNYGIIEQMELDGDMFDF